MQSNLIFMLNVYRCGFCQEFLTDAYSADRFHTSWLRVSTQPDSPCKTKRLSMDGGLTRGLLRGLVDRPEEAPLMDLDLKLQNIHSEDVSASCIATCHNSIGVSECCAGET